MDRSVEVITIRSCDRPLLLALIDLLNDSEVEPNSTLITFESPITRQELLAEMGMN